MKINGSVQRLSCNSSTVMFACFKMDCSVFGLSSRCIGTQGCSSVFGVMAMRSGLPHELKAQSFQRAAASCHLRRQHGVLQKMQPDRPVQALIIFSEPALNQIADHRQQFIESLALRRHFRLVAGGDEHIVVRLHLKDELFLHATLYAKADGFAKVEMTAILKTKRRGRSPALKFAGEI